MPFVNIEKIKNVDGDVLSKYEKQMKILQVVQRYAASLDNDGQTALQKEIDSSLKAKLAELERLESEKKEKEAREKITKSF